MNFHFDELIWRDDKHQHDQAMTWLTSIKSEDEFERMVMLIRFARCLSGNDDTSLNNRESRRLRVLIDKGFVRCFCSLITIFDRIVSFRKYLRRFGRKCLGRREDAPRDSYGRPIQ